MRDQKPRLRKFACLAAIAAMLALSGRAAERDLDDLLLVRLPAPRENQQRPISAPGQKRRPLRKTAAPRLPLHPVSDRDRAAAQYVAMGHSTKSLRDSPLRG
jgi:hypothetical protein